MGRGAGEGVVAGDKTTAIKLIGRESERGGIGRQIIVIHEKNPHAKSSRQI
jgi:hypothetical protein